MAADTRLIAIVDDEESVRKALVRLFKAASFEARAFPSARSFLLEADRLRIGCIVLDLQMPEMNGLELQQQLRAAHPGNTIPIVMITAHDEPGTRERCLAAGAAAYMRKPLESKALIATVAELARGTSPNG